jgi:hypothetical protein
MHVPIPHGSCSSHHQFYPLTQLQHSEQLHSTNDFLVLSMVPQLKLDGSCVDNNCFLDCHMKVQL